MGVKKTIHINGTDYTSYFTPVGARVSYKKIRGRNSGQMLDGSYTDDVVKTKAVVRVTCMPLTDQQVANMLTVTSQTYVTLRFYDPRLSTVREAMCMPSEPAFTDRGEGTNGENYWTGAVVTFTER